MIDFGGVSLCAIYSDHLDVLFLGVKFSNA
jgi:hypothetical protein